MNGYLKYIIENCKTAFDELCRINKGLNEEYSRIRKNDFNSNVDFQHLGTMDRMIKDYLVIRVAGLFDQDSRTISFNTVFPGHNEIKDIEQEEIVKKIIENRKRFVGHSDRDYISDGNFAIPTNEICDSNLKNLLKRLERLLDS